MSKAESVIKILLPMLKPMGFSLDPHEDGVEIRDSQGGCAIFDIEDCFYLYEGLRPKAVTLD